MPNMTSWLSGYKFRQRTPAAVRAAICWQQIQDEPYSIQFYVPGVNGSPATLLAAQTVRVEPGVSGSELNIEMGLIGADTATVYGIKDHPTVTATNMKRGYRFWLSDNSVTREFELESVDEVMGQYIGRGKAVS